MPSHHKVSEGMVLCTDCHEPHGMAGGALARSARLQRTVCTDCHTEIEGPFKFEHAAVTSEGCTACHATHGSANQHLLVRADVDALCKVCHAPSPDFETGVHMAQTGDHAKNPPSCTSCHVDIHGSNVSPAFIRKE
jgi:DmsE family decaheme c-type cytochrome